MTSNSEDLAGPSPFEVVPCSSSLFAQHMVLQDIPAAAEGQHISGGVCVSELEKGSCELKVLGAQSFAVAAAASRGLDDEEEEHQQGKEGGQQGAAACQEGACQQGEASAEQGPCVLEPSASSMLAAPTLTPNCLNNAIAAVLPMGAPPCGVKAVCGKRAKMEDAFSVQTCFFDLPASATDDVVNKLPARIATQVGEQLEQSLHSSSTAAPVRSPTLPRSPDQQQCDGTAGGALSDSSESSDGHGGDTLHFYGVYDGHGGTEAAQHCANRLHHHLSEALAALELVCMQQQSALCSKQEGGVQCQVEWRLTQRGGEAGSPARSGASSSNSSTSPQKVTVGAGGSEGGGSSSSSHASSAGVRSNGGAARWCEASTEQQPQQQQQQQQQCNQNASVNGVRLGQEQGGCQQQQQQQRGGESSTQERQHQQQHSTQQQPQQHSSQQGAGSAAPHTSYAAVAASSPADAGSDNSTEVQSDLPSTLSDLCSSGGCDTTSDPSDMDGSRGTSTTSPCVTTALEEALKEAFLRTDAEFAADGSAAMVGSTAVVALVGSKKAWVANCGDSRAVLCRGSKAIQLTDDHKPEREDEAERVERAGGQVLYWNGHRVMGVLAMSRAIGDHGLRPYVIPEPEVTVFTRAEDDDFLLLASDGLWDVMSNQEAISLAMRCASRAWEKGASRKAAVRIAASVLTKAAVDRGSKDNVTVVIIDLAGNGKEQRNSTDAAPHSTAASAGNNAMSSSCVLQSSSCRPSADDAPAGAPASDESPSKPSDEPSKADQKGDQGSPKASDESPQADQTSGQQGDAAQSQQSSTSGVGGGEPKSPSAVGGGELKSPRPSMPATDTGGSPSAAVKDLSA